MVKSKNEMERYQAMMRELLRSRETRESKRDINRLPIENVRAELEVNGCSCVGPKATLRERLLRATLISSEPRNRDIPWYPWDDVQGDAPGYETSSKTPRERVEVEQVTARVSGTGERPRRTTTASSSSEGERERNNVVRNESVQIHAPPTSTIITSAPITTVASGALTTATMVTPSCGTRPTAGVTRTLFAMRHVPNVMLSLELGTHLNGQGGNRDIR